MLFATVLPCAGYAQETEQYTMPKRDGSIGDKAVNGELMFYDMGGPDGATAKSYRGFVRFIPTNPGQEVRITFESLDLNSEAAVYVYDGNITFPNYSSPLPDGYMGKVTGTTAGQSFESTSGSLSVLYYSSYSASGAGWTAKVEEYTPADMTWSSVTTQTAANTVYRGQDSAPLMGVNLLTEGSNNPFTCSSLEFTLPEGTNLSDLSNIRVLYSKGSNTPGGEQFGDAKAVAGNTLTFSGTQALRGGNNYFWLVADIATDAVADNTLTASLNGATIADIQRVSSPLASSPVSIINEARIATDKKIYTVGQTPLTVYDDGGADGKISNEFTGLMSFKPSTNGKVIKITFTNLNLFNTSTVGKNDLLKIFSGADTSDDALLGAVLKEPTPVSFTSMASDGSLTISLASVTGYPTDGFTATVEEVEPQNMTIKSAETTAADNGTVCAGSENVKMLTVKLDAEGTLNPYTVTGMSFTRSGDVGITKATLYYSGITADGVPHKVGEIDAPGTDFTIALSEPQSLKERSNYFMLAYDFDNTAVNGQIAGATLKKVNDDYTVENAQTVTRLIENTYNSTTGRFTKVVYGEWKFQNTPSTSSSYGYDDTAGDQITTFIPGTAGKVIDMDFDLFKLYKSSYSPAPTFIIYDGEDTSAPVLWQATTTTFTTGPDMAIRATNDKGALTVKFNVNGGRGNSGYGFKATVSEYQSGPMVVTSAKASQLNDKSDIRPGQQGVRIMSLALNTTGDLNPLSIDELILNLKEGYSAVAKVKLYYTGRDVEFNDNTLIAETDVTAQNVTLTPNKAFTLPEKASNFWVTLDMQSSFKSDIPVDAAVASLKIGGKSIEVTDADPEGAAVTKNIYYFEGDDKTVVVDGSLLFYDDGGPDGKYTTSHKGSVTFMPANPGDVIRMTVQSFWTNYNDKLLFYEGADPAEDAKTVLELSGSKSDLDKNPIVVISKADDGAFTLTFNPKKNNINNGWEILVESFTPQPMTISGVEVTPVNDVKMLRGSSNNKLIKLAVTTQGHKGTVSVDKLDFSALDTDAATVSGARVWYTGKDDMFDMYETYGTDCTETPYTFSGDKSFDTAGTYYFWLAYDISPEATTESKVQAQFTALTSGENIISPADEKKVQVTVQDGMHGTYTVGTSGEFDFKSLSEAVAAMKDGIDGPVVFELEDGNYNELVTIPAVTGSSELNTITIRSMHGNRDNVILSYENYTDPGSSAYDKRYGVVTFDGVDYCTLQNVTVTSNNTRFPGIIFLRNKSEHITIDDCVVKAPVNNNSGQSSYLIYQYAKNEANCNNNYMTVSNCLLDGATIGVGLTGTGYIALPKQRGGRVLNNTFRNQAGKGVYINWEEDAVVSGNNITMSGESVSSPNAMDISDASGNLEISNNTICIDTPVNTQYTATATGLYLRGYNSDKVREGKIRVFNNEINMIGLAGTGNNGIRINSELPPYELVNNTINMTAADPSGQRVYGLYIAGAFKGGQFVNNIVNLNTPGQTIYVQRINYLDKVTFSNNVLFTPGDEFAYIGADPNGGHPDFTGGVKTFEEFCAQAPMTASFNEQTQFLSDKILEPAQAGSLINGIPVDFVDTDLYGAKRADTPTIGAYEYAESTVAPEMAESYPVIRNVTHNTAEAVVKSTLTGNMYYAVYEASQAAPSVESLKNEDLTVLLRKGVETSVDIAGLTPNTTYKLYVVLSSLRGLDSEIIASEEFTTTYEPTRVATFEEAKEEGMRLIDGTMSFTGFSIEAIEDGVAPAPNNKAASMDDEYAVIQLTNAVNIGLEGMFMRNDALVTVTAKDDKLQVLDTKTVAPSDKWSYVDLKPMGLFTYIELESEGNVSIDNVGALPLEMLASITRDEETPIKAGEAYTLNVEIDGGVAPYTYIWTDAARNEVATGQSYTYTPAVSGVYTVEATDSRGAKAAASTKVRVLGDMAIATFEDLYLDEDSHWCGDVDNEDYMQGSFFSGSFEFNNLYMADWDSWAFFGYANHTSTSFSTYVKDQWNSAVGHGADNSANYGVVYVSPYMGRTVTTLSNTEEGQVIPGMYITNSAWVVDAILNGDGMSDGAFAQDDNLMLQLKGTAADGTETSLEIPLADYRADNDKDHWYLDTWQWVDLSPLGAVTKVEWNMSSTKQNSYGMTTPSYVCIDNIGASCPVTTGATAILKVNDEYPTDSFSLAPYFSFNPEDGTVSYDITCSDKRVSLNGEKVTCSAKADENLELTAHATQRGKHEWVRIPVSMTNKPSGIVTPEMEGVNVYPNPADSYVNIYAEADSYSLHIIGMDGRTLMSKYDITGNTTLDVSSLAQGTYLVKLVGADSSTAVRKLIVRH